MKNLQKLVDRIHKETTAIKRDYQRDCVNYEFALGIQIMGNIVVEWMEEIYDLDFSKYKVETVDEID